MHRFVAEAASALSVADPVVEVGSRPAVGQEDLTIRQLFENRQFVGCDIQRGPGVDRVEDTHALSFPDESVSTFIAVDTLEHVADPIRAMEEAWRVLRPGGVALITSVMFFPIHAHPWDYWRFTPEGFARLLQPFESRLVMAFGWELMPETVFGIGIKGPYSSLSPGLFPETSRRCEEWGSGLRIDLGPFRMSVRGLWGLTARKTLDELGRRLTGFKPGHR